MKNYLKKFRLSFPFNKCYCISLKASKDRRRLLSKELKFYGLKNYTIVDAISADDDVVNRLYSEGLVAKFPPCFRCKKSFDCKCDNNILIPSQIATFLSHKKIWEKILLDNNTDLLYLIIEDDVKFNPYFKIFRYYFNYKINKLYRNNKHEPFLLRLGWAKNSDHYMHRIQLVSNTVKMSNPIYAINSAMAQKLLENIEYNTTVDIYIHKVIGLQVQSNFTLFPPIAHDRSMSLGTVSSLIHPRENRIKKLKLNNNSENLKELGNYAQHIKKAVYKKILCIGHPRTGSGYTSELLISFGLDVCHEKMGKDGISSWMFSVFDWSNPFFLNPYAKSRYFSHFETIIMFARDPLTAIPSIVRENENSLLSYNFRKKHILENLNIEIKSKFQIHRAIDTYYYWTKLCIKLNNPEIIFRIEYDEILLFQHLKKKYSINFNTNLLPDKNVNSNKNYNKRKIDKILISENDWIGLDLEYKAKINELCSTLNYNPIYTKDYKNVLRT